MIDPDGLQITTLSSGNSINVIANEINPCNIEVYCLEDEKEFKHFIDDIERQVRRSFEYREYIKYLRDNMSMNQCSFLKDITNQESYDIKIEIHHYPFSLNDITRIVIRKRMYYKESLSVQMCAKEVMELHYKLMIGLIPLSETVHQLAHSGRIFIPVDKVMGRYNLFIDYYKPFIEPELLETLDRIEKYSNECQSRILDTTILNQNNIIYDVKDDSYKLPDMNKVNESMLIQMQNIKDNNYVLPNVKEEQQLIEDKKEYGERVIKDLFIYE